MHLHISVGIEETLLLLLRNVTIQSAFDERRWKRFKNKQMKKRKQCAGLQCELGQRRETRSAWVRGSETAVVGEWSGRLLRNSFLNTWNPIGRPRKKTFCYQFWYFLFRFISTVEEKSTTGILFFTYNCDNMAIQLRYSTHTSKELSSSIFQSLSVSKASVTPVQNSTFSIYKGTNALYWPSHIN